MKVIKGDSVKILCGKDRGKSGEVLHVFPRTSKVLVKGINIVTKNQKRNQDGSAPGRIQIELPVHASNVQVINPETDKPARVGYELVDGKKIRVFKGKASKKTESTSKKATKPKKK